jgi:Flp pilus assembly protein TadG
MAPTHRNPRRGHAILELALIAPWFYFLAVGALDWGFYSYALITTESAARVAANYTSGASSTLSDTTGACAAVLGVMRKLPNVSAGITTCNALPIKVTATAGTGPDSAAISTVSVTYQSIALIPIPGILTNQLTVTRSVEMRVRG